MIKKLKEDMKKGKLYAVKELWFGIHSGRKTYIVSLLSIALNYYLYTKNVSNGLWVLALSAEYLVLEMCHKHSTNNEGML